MAEWQNIRWIRVGWQGFTFMLPEDWNIGAIGGDRNEGYLRFEDGDMPRLEIKWADAGTTFVDLNRVIDKYLRDMAKDKKSRVEVSRDVQLVSKRKLRGKKSGQFFAWKGETQPLGAITLEVLRQLGLVTDEDIHGEALKKSIPASCEKP